MARRNTPSQLLISCLERKSELRRMELRARDEKARTLAAISAKSSITPDFSFHNEQSHAVQEPESVP